ncbi:MAG TPA: RES family NAD+ phosphorylase [Mucilaginibacter sp.]|jgi:RES domain-containing protein
MTVYRLCKQAHINDLSGRGAEMNGGRWNNKGLPALYTACSRALAVLEVAVHVPLGIMPINYYMIAIEIPDGLSISKVNIANLPANWNSNPIVKTTQYIGDDFLKSNTHLILEVPSATVPGDYNYIINPAHHDFSRLKITSAEPFEFDSRLFKR